MKKDVHVVREKFRSHRNYAVSYGRSDIKDFAHYDVVIVEPANFTVADIQSMQAQGTLVIAYVSIIEIHSSHVLWGKLLVDDFLRVNGERLREPLYDTYLLDLTSDHWRGVLTRHIGSLLTMQKYDGIFLDTIGDVERLDLPQARAQLDAAVALVEDIRHWFPETVLIQNNGLEMLCDRTATLLDAIVWENPPLDGKDSEAWVQLIAKKLTKIEHEFGTKILVLFDGADEMRRKEWIQRTRFADHHRFTLYIAPRHYQGSLITPEPQL